MIAEANEGGLSVKNDAASSNLLQLLKINDSKNYELLDCVWNMEEHSRVC